MKTMTFQVLVELVRGLGATLAMGTPAAAATTVAVIPFLETRFCWRCFSEFCIHYRLLHSVCI